MSRAGDTATIADLRLELASEAARTLRKNRPLHLLWIGAALLLIAGVALGLSVAQRLSASADAARAESNARELLTLAGKLKQLEAAASQPGRIKLGEPVAGIQSRISRLATTSGVKQEPKPPVARSEPPVGGVRRTTLEYQATDDSIEHILKWIDAAVKDIPGLEVYALTIRPEAQQWNVKVRFARWELVAGGPS